MVGKNLTINDIKCKYIKRKACIFFSLLNDIDRELKLVKNEKCVNQEPSIEYLLVTKETNKIWRKRNSLNFLLVKIIYTVGLNIYLFVITIIQAYLLIAIHKLFESKCLHMVAKHVEKYYEIKYSHYNCCETIYTRVPPLITRTSLIHIIHILF